MAAGVVERPGGRVEDSAPIRHGAAILTGLARAADRRGDRQLRSVYVAALGELAALHVARLRAWLP